MKKLISMLLVGIFVLSGIAAGMPFAQKSPLNQSIFFNQCDMVIIAREMFSDTLQPLIDHKNSVGVENFLKTTEEIYSEYQGRDKPEQIKYCIKDMIEKFDIKYVLLIGDIQKTLIRKTEVNHIWGSPENHLL
jgi:hypothetical protein